MILTNDEIRIAKIKHGDTTIQHAFHHILGAEPFIKRISSLNLKHRKCSVGKVCAFKVFIVHEPNFKFVVRNLDFEAIICRKYTSYIVMFSDCALVNAICNDFIFSK